MASNKETYAQKFANGSTWGRPRIYKTEDEMAANVLGYFQHCEGVFDEDKKDWTRKPEEPTITGLCLFLGFESRSSFDKQAERSDDFSYIVKRAKMIVEGRYEGMLASESVGGAIFALKNMGWKDKQEIDTNQNINMSGSLDTRVEIDYTKLSDAALAEIAALNNQSEEGQG